MYGVQVLALSLLYLAAGRLGHLVDHVQDDNRVLFPQAGVALAGLIFFGISRWPAVLLGSLGVTTLLNPEAVVVPTKLALQLAFTNTIAAVLGAWLLTRISKFKRSFPRIADVYSFLLWGVIVAPLVGATLVVGLHSVGSEMRFDSLRTLWWKRWFGIGISNLVVAPVLLTWSGRTRTGWPLRRFLELALLVSALALVCLYAFTGRSAIATLDYPVSFVPFPFVIWAALRFGPRGAASATFMIAAITIAGTSQNFGPFSRRVDSDGLLLLQVYLTAVAISALFLAAALAEQRDTADEVRESHAQLRAFSVRLEKSREEERAQLSREIHDELGQQLTTFKISLKSLRRKLQETTGLPMDLLERFDRLMNLADESLVTVRRLATDLRPGILDDLGIVDALASLVEQFTERTGCQAELQCDVPYLELDRDQSLAVFRVVQESLTNISRHAGADKVTVRIGTENQEMIMEVADNGSGIRLDSSGKPKTLGILGMKERAISVGGWLSVEPGSSGTTVTMRIPLAKTSSTSVQGR